MELLRICLEQILGLCSAFFAFQGDDVYLTLVETQATERNSPLWQLKAQGGMQGT